jgi:hypothetical protein
LFYRRRTLFSSQLLEKVRRNRAWLLETNILEAIVVSLERQGRIDGHHDVDALKVDSAGWRYVCTINSQWYQRKQHPNNAPEIIQAVRKVIGE